LGVVASDGGGAADEESVADGYKVGRAVFARDAFAGAQRDHPFPVWIEGPVPQGVVLKLEVLVVAPEAGDLELEVVPGTHGGVDGGVDGVAVDSPEAADGGAAAPFALEHGVCEEGNVADVDVAVPKGGPGHDEGRQGLAE